MVQQHKGERNFHIFYQLIKGASKELRAKLGLETDPMKYVYLSKCADVPSINDKKDFEEVSQAFGELEITESEAEDFYSVTAAVLTLGNITFEEGRADQAKVDGKSEKWCGLSATNLGIDEKLLAEAIVTREIRVRGQETTKAALDLAQSSDARHALAKFIYGRQFDWLVTRINQSMGSAGSDLYIGILDIFGFEIFKHNSFEQLCINYTNEMLQQHFNNNTFKLEEKVYTAEGIEFAHIDFIDNDPMIELITKKGTGILPTLDEELIIPGGSDKGFMESLTDNQATNAVFQRNAKSFRHFGVKHYAGLVEYDSDGFLEKNRDTLQMDLIEMLQTSSNSLIQHLYPPDEEVTAKDRKSSLSRQFQKQLQDLMRQLYKTEPHYIRCIKPNESKKPMSFVPQNCYEQLTYSGVFEAVAIRKQGYPFRLKHQEFADRYAKICKGGVEGATAKKLCEAICKKMKLEPENVRMGKTKVLYRAMEYRKLELEWEIITKHETILANLERLTSADHESMEHDEKENYIVRLADAVRQADLFRIKTKTAEKGRKMLEIFVEERMDPKTKKQLAAAIESMDLGKLEAVLEVCDREGYLTKLVRKCRELCEQIQDAEAALKVAMAEVNEEYIEKALAMCDEFEYHADSVNNARKVLKQIKKAKSGVKKALVPPYKAEWTRKAIEYCISVNYTNFDGFAVCNAIRQSIITAREQLTTGQSKKDQKVLEAALAFCYDVKNFNGHKYTSSLEAECKELLVEVSWVNKETIKGTTECEEHQVRAVVAKANEIGMKNKALDALKKLVKGDYAVFLSEQFKKAKKCKHHARAIRVSIKVKDRELNKKGPNAFRLDGYPGLKIPMEWSKEKFTWGSTEKRAQAMMVWQLEHLHAPMTRTSVAIGGDPHQQLAMTTRVVNCFDTVQKAMGERNTLKMPFRFFELLNDGVSYPEIRDEIYIAIIKQCTDNGPDKAGAGKPGYTVHVQRAMELLALCLCHFPPSDQFENFLETFVRSRDATMYGGTYNLKGLVRRRMYFGPAKASEMPQENEFAQQLRYDGKRYADGGIAPVLSSKLRLSDFDEKAPKKGKGAVSVSEKKKEKKEKKGKKDKGSKRGTSKSTSPSVNEPQWEPAVDPSTGKTYYYNKATKETSWTAPESMA